MKRLLLVCFILGAIATLTLSHLALGAKDSDAKMVWCHARDAVIAPESWQVDADDGDAAQLSENADSVEVNRAGLAVDGLLD